MPHLLGQWQHLLDDVPAYLLLVLQHVGPLSPMLFFALWYCAGLLSLVRHTCFLCSGLGGVASLFPLIFWCIISLFLLMIELPGLDWEVSSLCSYIPCLDSPLEVGLSDITTL